MKQVIVVNSDLKISRGKWMAQACHASVEAGWKVFKHEPKTFRKWRGLGQKKVVLKADEKTLFELLVSAKSLKIRSALIRDAGLTELKPGTTTCLGLGPAEDKLLDKLIGSLSLFK